MKSLLVVFLFLYSSSTFSKEWKSLSHYKKETNLTHLTSKDWLKSDRKKNTKTWRQANVFNLNNNHPEEYTTIEQRRDFYEWYYKDLSNRGYEVVWPKMAHFISNKLRLVSAFPYSIFINKNVKKYAYLGSEQVFNEAFYDMKLLFYSKDVVTGKFADKWDANILLKEQYQWIESIYQTMDEKSLVTIEHMAKGKGIYTLMVAREIRFEGDITDEQVRFDYAMLVLRNYCKNTYE